MDSVIITFDNASENTLIRTRNLLSRLNIKTSLLPPNLPI